MGQETITPEQMDFNAVLFAGRKVLYVSEVAERLEIGEQSVRDLIEEGKLHAIDVGGGSRKFWRIPVTAFERFVKERSSMAKTFSP
jgi:excisionase family DNA binding protein